METLAAVTTELYHKATEGRAYIYATRYYYDESGNRIRKLIYFNAQADPAPITDWNNPGNGWTLSNNEFYLKGIDGKDLATYQGNVLDEWFVWGNDLTGKIKNDKEYYYYKDHLGSVRAVVDNTGAIVAGFDYDAWGYPLENRNYNGDSIKYKYTGKEFDKESFYDYFGARYYDARIANWTSVDPLMEKHYSFSPYNYALRNPLRFADPDGKQLDVIINSFVKIMGSQIGKAIGKEMAGGGELAKGFGKENMDIDKDGKVDDRDEIDNRDDNQKILDALNLERKTELEVPNRLKPIDRQKQKSLEELSPILKRQIKEENEQHENNKKDEKIWELPIQEIIKELIY